MKWQYLEEPQLSMRASKLPLICHFLGPLMLFLFWLKR